MTLSPWLALFFALVPIAQALPQDAAPGEGYRGRLLDPEGKPVAGARIYLMPRITNPFHKLVIQQRRSGAGTELLPDHMRNQVALIPERDLSPVATGKSDAQGRFRVTMHKPGERRVVDAWILHDRFCDLQQSDLLLHLNPGVDAGDIVLRPGAIIFGSISDAATGSPLAGVTVRVLPKVPVPSHICPAPGRETGNATKTDAAGAYRLGRIDAKDGCTIQVSAPGFVPVVKGGVDVPAGENRRINFALARGNSIAGAVVGWDGKPVAGATILMVWLRGQGAGIPTEAETDDRGQFKITGLGNTPVRVVVRARGYISRREMPIAAGTKDLKITLREQAKVHLVVIGKSGKPLADYAVRLLYSGLIGPVGSPPVGKQRLVRNAVEGAYTFDGIIPGSYALEVKAKGHAVGYSKPFLVGQEGGKLEELVVKLGLGGSIEGVVVDGAGKPVSGAVVRTAADGLGPVGNALARATLTSSQLTWKEVRSDENGRFRLDLLTNGDYRLVITHPGFCTTDVRGVKIYADKTVVLKSVAMSVGTVVVGIALANGKPTENLKATITRVDKPGVSPLMVQAISDARGRFVVGTRLPPGSYLATLDENLGGNPLLGVARMNQSLKRFQIKPGQKEVELELGIKD